MRRSPAQLAFFSLVKLPYDNETDTYGIHSLVRWIVTPGQELFLVFNETAQRENGAVSPVFQDVALKLEYTVRF